MNNSRNFSGTTSLENSNIPLVRVNKIVDELENLELDDFGQINHRPMTANASESKLSNFDCKLCLE